MEFLLLQQTHILLFFLPESHSHLFTSILTHLCSAAMLGHSGLGDPFDLRGSDIGFSFCFANSFPTKETITLVGKLEEMRPRGADSRNAQADSHQFLIKTFHFHPCAHAEGAFYITTCISLKPSVFSSGVFSHLPLSFAWRTALRTPQGERLGGSSQAGEINYCCKTSFPLSALNDI